MYQQKKSMIVRSNSKDKLTITPFTITQIRTGRKKAVRANSTVIESEVEMVEKSEES